MAKLKVTLSLDRTLLGAVDQVVRREDADSRSAVVEEALRMWQLEHRRHQLERQVEAYYRSQTAKERREDRDWARLSSGGLPARRRPRPLGTCAVGVV